MENLDNDYLYYSCILIDVLLENPDGLGDLIIELENLKKEYCRNIKNWKERDALFSLQKKSE